MSVESVNLLARKKHNEVNILPALTETEVLTLSLADVAVLGPHEPAQLVVDVTLECPDGSASSS